MESYFLKDLFDKPISGEWGTEIQDNREGSAVIRTTNFTNIGEIDYNNLTYRNIDLVSKKNKILKPGDIIIEKSGGSPDNPVGRVVYFNEKNNNYFTNNFTAILRTKKNNNSKYLFYLLYYFHKKRVVSKFQNKTTGIINLQLNSYLKNTNVKIPNLEIQKKVVKLLDTLRKLMKIRKEQIQTYDDLIESLFFDIFGDIRTNNKNIIKRIMGDVLTVNQGLQIPISKRLKSEEENSYKYLTIKYLNGNSYPEFIKNPKESVICNDDDILVTRTGNTGQIITNVSGVFHNNFFKLNYDRNMFNKYYLYRYLNTNYVQNKMKLMAGTSTIPDLNHGDFYKIEVLIPPIEMQNKFADYVLKIEEEKKKLRESLEELETLFDALMQDAFSENLFKD